MSSYTTPVQVLIDELGRLPGIGPKSAQRIAFHLLKVPADDVHRLVGLVRERVRAATGVTLQPELVMVGCDDAVVGS